MSSIIRLENIVKKFYIGEPNELEILHGISLEVEEGEFVSIVGPSGSGKSTLMNMIKSFLKLEIRKLVLFFKHIIWFQKQMLWKM